VLNLPRLRQGVTLVQDRYWQSGYIFNEFASASTLRGQMQTKSQSIFNSGVFQSQVLEQDRIAIEEYYRERGYVDAQVLDVSREIERDEEEEQSFLILTVFVDEGSQYSFGGIDFDGNTIFDDAELAEQIRLAEGSVLNLPRLRQGVTLVQDRYWQSGYIFNEFDLQENRDERELVISFTMQIVERPRAHIERISVRGNEKTSDQVILREIPLEVGDVFSVGRIREGIQNLNNLQYFSSVAVENPPGSVDGLMELIVNVEETQTADINFGVAFGGGGEFPVSAQVGWSDRNFLGQGQTVGFQLQASPLEQLLSFNFLERWFADQRWSIGADFSVNRSIRQGIPQDILLPIFGGDEINAVPDPYEGYYVFGVDGTEYPASSGTFYDRGDLFPDAVTEALIEEFNLNTDYEFAGGSAAIPDDYLMNYTEWTISIGGNTGYRFRTTLGTLALGTSLRSSLSFVGYDPDQFRPYSEELRANLDDWQLINQWGVNASLDRRRGIPLSPSSGYRVTQGFNFTGGLLLGDRHFIRSDTSGEAYFTLWDIPAFLGWNFKGVLAMQSGVSFIFPQIWVPAEFRTNPQEPVAGTSLLSTNPMFLGRGWDARTGGEALWDNWLELRIPIAEQVLWLDTFFDAVGIWEDREDILSPQLSDMLFGFGAGFRFTIPQFPIRIYLAKRFRYTETGDIEWQQGELFNGDNTPDGGLDFVFAIGGDLF
jgi:outer membrane protein insertion porin family